MLPGHVRYALWCDAVRIELRLLELHRLFAHAAPPDGRFPPLFGGATPQAALLPVADGVPSDDWLAAYV